MTDRISELEEQAKVILEWCRQQKELPEEQRDSEAVKLRQRIAAYIRKHSLGSCRIFSIGSQCQCPLCDLDRLFQLTRLSKESNESKDSEAVELLRESRALLEAASDRPTYTLDEIDWIDRVRKFLEGK